MPRDGIRQSRAQHHELMLPFAFGSPHRAPHRIIQTSQLALGAGIHIAHTRHHRVRMIVQIQAVADQLFDVDLWWTFKRPSTTGTPAGSFTALTAIAAMPRTTILALAATMFAAAGSAATRTTATLATTRPAPTRPPGTSAAGPRA